MHYLQSVMHWAFLLFSFLFFLFCLAWVWNPQIDMHALLVPVSSYVRCPVVSEKHCLLTGISHLWFLDFFSDLSFPWIPEPWWEGCNVAIPFTNEHSKVPYSPHCPAVDFCVNCHLLQASLMMAEHGTSLWVEQYVIRSHFTAMDI